MGCNSSSFLYLSSLPKASELSLKYLTLKLTMLFTLVSVQQGRSLHMLDIQLIGEDTCWSLPFQHYKVPSTLLQAYHVDLSLFVFTHAKECLHRTKLLAKRSSNKAFPYHVKPHDRAYKDTISGWIRSAMTMLELVLALVNLMVPEGSCSINIQKFICSSSRNSRHRWLIFLKNIS